MGAVSLPPLRLLSERLAVCRLDPQAPLPALIWKGSFLSITRTPDELSLVLPEALVQPGWQAEGGWRAFQVGGPLDFSLVGILSRLAVPLAEAGVSIFAVSTYDTDYVLVWESDLEKAVAALSAAGWVMEY